MGRAGACGTSSAAAAIRSQEYIIHVIEGRITLPDTAWIGELVVMSCNGLASALAGRRVALAHEPGLTVRWRRLRPRPAHGRDPVKKEWQLGSELVFYQNEQVLQSHPDKYAYILRFLSPEEMQLLKYVLPSACPRRAAQH